MPKFAFPLILAALLLPTAAAAQWSVDPSVTTSTVKYEWCMTVSSTTYPGPILAGARNVTIDNRSSATAYIEWDASAVTTAGATGDKWAAGDKFSVDAQSVPFLRQATGAATASMSTGACMFVRQWK